MRLPIIRNPARLAIASAIAILVAGAAAFYAGSAKQGASAAEQSAQQTQPAVPVRVAQAQIADLAPRSQTPGSVVSVSDSEIAAATPGKILWVAEIGSNVAANDVIARIDPTDSLMARDESRSDIKRLQSRADYLTRLFKRYDELGEDAGESEAVVDQMRADRDEALQNLERARVALRRAETAFERTEVRAPFEGRIAARLIEVGEFANPGAPVARLVNTENLEVTARATDQLLAAVKPGDLIDVVYGAETLKAKVRAVIPVGDTVSRTLELRLVLPATSWHIGSAVQVSLPRSAPKRVIAVNRDALILRADRVSVFTIAEGNVAKQVDVELGAAEGELIEIVGEINAGDRVVVRGGERLRDGQVVTIQNADGEASTLVANSKAS